MPIGKRRACFARDKLSSKTLGNTGIFVGSDNMTRACHGLVG
jgi:hypothetical protein